MAVTNLRSARVRATFLQSLKTFLGGKTPDTITRAQLIAWETKNCNSTAVQATKYGHRNKDLPANVRGKFGAKLCWPAWLTNDPKLRADRGVFYLPWEDLKEGTTVVTKVEKARAKAAKENESESKPKTKGRKRSAKSTTEPIPGSPTPEAQPDLTPEPAPEPAPEPTAEAQPEPTPDLTPALVEA